MECVCPSELNIVKPNLQGNGVWTWGLRGWLGHKGRALMNGISALREEAWEFPHLFSMGRRSQKLAAYETGSELSADTQSAGALVLDF